MARKISGRKRRRPTRRVGKTLVPIYATSAAKEVRRGAGALPQSWRRRPVGRRREQPEAFFGSAQDGDRRATVARRAAGSGGPANECLGRQADRLARSCSCWGGDGLERTRTRRP